MPASKPAPSGAPCWIDLYTSDPDRAAAFYAEIFGWAASEPDAEYGGYVTFTKNGAPIAGMMRNDGSTGDPDSWTTYLSVPDVKATTEAATAAGGQVHMEPMQVGSQGSMAILADPGGAAFGLWQPDEHRGFGLDSEPGAPCWHELHTREYAAVLDFYRTVFGVQTRTMSDEDSFRYSALVADDNEYAGVMDASGFLAEGAPSTWQVYLGVQDIDATLAQADELGATVLAAVEGSPFGRLAQIADPTGAPLKLVEVVSG